MRLSKDTCASQVCAQGQGWDCYWRRLGALKQLRGWIRVDARVSTREPVWLRGNGTHQDGERCCSPAAISHGASLCPSCSIVPSPQAECCLPVCSPEHRPHQPCCCRGKAPSVLSSACCLLTWAETQAGGLLAELGTKMLCRCRVWRRRAPALPGRNSYAGIAPAAGRNQERPRSAAARGCPGPTTLGRPGHPCRPTALAAMAVATTPPPG